MSMDMQLQMRRNVDEMHASIGDLSAWTSEIGKRDRSLRPGTAGSQAATQAATEAARQEEEEEDAREIAAAKEELRRLYGEEQSTDPAPRSEPVKGSIGQKYDKWNHFNAEGVIKQLEESEADKERLRLEVARLENRRARRAQQEKHEADAREAEVLRQQGNDAFAAARYEQATERYTSALERTPRSAVLYANRGLALLKLGAEAEAEQDCDAALMIEPTYVKARMRRAQARRALGNYDGALEDIEVALEVEPRNAAARKMMAECRQLRASTANTRAAAPLRTLEIRELTRDPANDANQFVALVSGGTVAPPSAPAAGAAAAPSGDRAPPATGAASPGASSSSAAAAPSAAAAARRAPTACASAFGAPSSAADVERAWRSLRGAPAEWTQYVRRLDLGAISSLFKTNLPAELFSAFAAAAASYADSSREDAAHAHGTLLALSRAGRFSILTMCMDKADTKAVAEVFAKLQAAQARGDLPAISAEDLAALRAKYA